MSVQPAERSIPLGVIVGPTAIGKTGLAVELARRFDAEIVGADSMQVYRGFDIGTAKPTPEELGGVAHHLIDVVEPDEPFDAVRYVEEADRRIAEIHARGRRVLVAGGTGLYVRALLHGVQKGPAPDPRVREVIVARAQRLGWSALHAELAQTDPETAGRLHPNDGVRILRALEVLETTGRSISHWQEEHGFRSWRYPAKIFGLSRPREELYRRVDQRVDAMMDGGFLEEVRARLDAGLSPRLKPMQGLGYRRLVAHLLGESSLEEAVENTKTDTRRFAKRQLTWFNKEEGLAWCPPDRDRIAGELELFWERRDLRGHPGN